MIPHASTMIDAVRTARSVAGDLLLGLDFDGTLALIVARPEDAALLPGAGTVLRSLAQRRDTRIAILTGRALADLTETVGLDNAFYAGNHGLERTGPGIHRVPPQAAASRPSLREIAPGRRERLTG